MGGISAISTFVSSGVQHARTLGLRARIGATLAHLVHGPHGSVVAHPSLTVADAVVAIGRLDVAGGMAGGAKAVAAFDLDGTVFKGNIVPAFARLLAHEGGFTPVAGAVFDDALRARGVAAAALAPLDANGKARLVLDMMEDAPGVAAAVSDGDFFYLMERALAGQRRSDLVATAQRLVNHGGGGVPAWHTQVHASGGRSMADVVHAARERGLEPIAITLGFDWLAEAAAPLVGIHPSRVFASQSVVSGGVLTGATLVQLDKATTLQRVLGGAPMVSFGDSLPDAAMFRMSKLLGFAVNPKPELLEAIRAAKFPVSVINFEGTMADALRGSGALQAAI